jgi:hypothetical protein
MEMMGGEEAGGHSAFGTADAEGTEKEKMM